MDDRHQLFQFAESVFIGIIFSFLLAKLISTVVSSREESPSIVRRDSVENESKPSSIESKRIGEDSGASNPENSTVCAEEPALIADDADSDDDCEGVDSTELDEEFSVATEFVAVAAADRLSEKVSKDVQLQLYGLYKIATEGPCSARTTQ